VSHRVGRRHVDDVTSARLADTARTLYITAFDVAVILIAICDEKTMNDEGSVLLNVAMQHVNSNSTINVD